MLSTFSGAGPQTVAQADQLSLIVVITLFVLLIAKEIAGSVEGRVAAQANRALQVPLIPLAVVFLITAAWHFGRVIRLPF